MSAVALPRPLQGLAYWQPVFEAESIALFPVGPDKRPLVRNWQKTTPHASRSWASRFAGEQAFGFLPRRAGITVLDIDSADERFAQSLFDHYGEPKALVRTASGKFHGFYRHSGERRMVRPEGTLNLGPYGGGFTYDLEESCEDEGHDSDSEYSFGGVRMVGAGVNESAEACSPETGEGPQ